MSLTSGMHAGAGAGRGGGRSRDGADGDEEARRPDPLLAAGLVSERYLRQGREALRARGRLAAALLSSRRPPARGWDEAQCEMLLAELAAMDSNNFPGNAGVGEREGRVRSGIVRRRHFRLAHGMGRSGDVSAEQPKAAGSSVAVRLADIAARDAMREAGALPAGMDAMVLPLATGMALSLTLSALRSLGRGPAARLVLFPRVDQKTCLKVAASCGYELEVLPNALAGDEVVTDLGALEARIAALGAGAVACVMCTASCFAPRAPDDVVGVARVCARHGVPCVVNNAYGVQARRSSRLLCEAARAGRVDAVVQSTDKNFMVPVGGAVVAARPEFLRSVSRAYPGRASIAPSVDLLVTLLELGREGWRRCLDDRERLYARMRERLREVAAEEGERLLETPGNPISMAITLSTLGDRDAEVTFFGSMLFARQVSGTRAVTGRARASVAGAELLGFGAHADAYPVPYLAAAAAVGATDEDVDTFVRRLRGAFKDYRRRQRKRAEGGAAG